MNPLPDVQCNDPIPSTSTPPAPPARSRRILKKVTHHLRNHVGSGLIASVAYFDPGNWSVDLEAGSLYGYKLLFVVLFAGVGAMVLQTMATKLGCVTGNDLAQQCRLLLHDRPKHPRLVRWLVLYPLYVLAEIAIIATDLAEVLGCAIALQLLIPSLPLVAAVLITALDVFIFLLFSDPGRGNGKPAKLFEAIVIALVLVVFISFVVLVIKVKPQWGPVFKGFLPSKTLVESNALYTGIGIIGATVMPHALFLGSSLATQDRVGMLSPTSSPSSSRAETETLPGPAQRRRRNLRTYVRALFAASKVDLTEKEMRRGDGMRHAFVKEHLGHAIVDTVMSLLGFAVTINSAILIVAATAFFYATSTVPGDNPTGPTPMSASLFDAYHIIRRHLGHGAAVIFAIALLASGQSAALTATLSAQVVSEGFIVWRMSPFLTRATTRLLALIPATIVAAVVGQEGIATLLVASQVVLSLVLPFVVFPLVWASSNRRIMTVTVITPETDSEGEPEAEAEIVKEKGKVRTKEVCYRNGKVMETVGYLLFGIVLLADVVAVVLLAGA